MFLSLVLFYQLIIRPILSYAVLAFTLLNLIYLTLKRYNVYYKNYVDAADGTGNISSAVDDDDDVYSDDEDAQASAPRSETEIKNSISVLLYAYIGVFFFVGLNDVFCLEKWVPFWVEIYAAILLWIVFRCDNLLEHQELFAALFEKQEMIFEEHIRPILRLLMTKVTALILSGCLMAVESIVEHGLVEKEATAKMRKDLDHASLICAKASKSKSSSAKRLRKSMHTLR
eukprot:CAMPEP_0117442694 /NCGR_PEP_ID=MMETSP0759-20121206/4289_1 /TAXON_ID=63605 /ORGANISM="Percolomonas cosmopolitus, Strain WS" /LENGTH=228 /DNA_ID=CAMNT_0005234601 /DNA_START=81 /DNA_END=767 /DNA_ORIENTATION=+